MKKTRVKRHKRGVNSILPQAKEKNYRTNYRGSKKKLIDYIINMTPKDVKSIYDAFTGSGIVAYEYKRRGYRVICNDVLEYPYRLSHALIENSHTKLAESDIQMLMREDRRHPHFVKNTFRHVYFTPSILNEIDSIRYNCDNLTSYKKSLALAALGRACIGSQQFGHFTVTKQSGFHKRNKNRYSVSLSEFKARFRKECKYLSSLVFDNGKSNKAYFGDIKKNTQKVTADLAYFDPPYVTEFSNTNYERTLHFIEGLMSYWKGKKIDHSTKTKVYTMEGGLNKKNIGSFFDKFLGYHKRFRYTMLSYRDKAHPRANEIKKIYKKNKGKVEKFKKIDYLYNSSAKYGDASRAKEYLFLTRRVK